MEKNQKRRFKMSIEIGGLSRFEMVGKDTVKGAKLKDFPPAPGKSPWALRQTKDLPPCLYKIIWKDREGQLREGFIHVKEKGGSEKNPSFIFLDKINRYAIIIVAMEGG